VAVTHANEELIQEAWCAIETMKSRKSVERHWLMLSMEGNGYLSYKKPVERHWLMLSLSQDILRLVKIARSRGWPRAR